MAFLTVASQTISVVEGGGDVDYTEIGDRARADDGTMRASITARKKRWSVKTFPLTRAAADALIAALIASPTGTLTGDWVNGASITVWPQIQKETPIATSPPTYQLTIAMDQA